MNKVVDAGQWIIRNFLPISLIIFIVIYLRWFRLTPLEFGHYNDPNAGYIAGLILLGLYSVLTILFRISKDHVIIRVLLFIPTIFLLFLNIAFLFWFSPRMITTAKCNGFTYYISTGSPLSDPQWSYFQFTKWRGVFYDSHFFGYSGYKYEIICDEEKKEANVVFGDILDSTDGKHPRSYIHMSVKLNNQLYVLSETWDIPEYCGKDEYRDCDIYRYTLYECKSGYTSCDALPIQYTIYDSEFFYLEVDEITGEINLFDNDEDDPDRILIFTWGEHPRCYVEGCKIPGKK